FPCFDKLLIRHSCITTTSYQKVPIASTSTSNRRIHVAFVHRYLSGDSGNNGYLSCSVHYFYMPRRPGFVAGLFGRTKNVSYTEKNSNRSIENSHFGSVKDRPHGSKSSPKHIIGPEL
ncbi:hypothetical protein ACFL5Z_21170, partial [Planctomycetota bacterium]